MCRDMLSNAPVLRKSSRLAVILSIWSVTMDFIFIHSSSDTPGLSSFDVKAVSSACSCALSIGVDSSRAVVDLVW
jgi:hypothetical protein